MSTAPAGATRAPWRAMCGLATTQMVGWGSTYHIPAVLVRPLREDLALSSGTIFGGVTVMLVVSTFVAPAAGRYMARYGARLPLITGTVCLAAALFAMAFAQGFWSYLLPWVLIGIAIPIGLTQAAVTAVVERAAHPRRAIGTLLLMIGLSSTIFWPLTTWLESVVGWRGACLVFAAAHLVICLPIHALLLGPARAPGEAAGVAADDPTGEKPLPPRFARLGIVLVAVTTSLAGFVSWGLPLQMVETLTGLGHERVAAVWIATMLGPAQVLSRLGEIAFGHRIGIIAVGVVSTAIMPFAMALPLALGHSMSGAVVLVVGYGLSAGAMTIVRSVLPLGLFGRERYARLLGELAVPQNAGFALAPLAFAWAMDGYGPDGVLLLAAFASLGAFSAMLGIGALARHARSG